MNILLVSPLGFPINKDSRYTGIEALVYNYSVELSKTNNVTVMGHYQSIFPDGVAHLKTNPEGLEMFAESELKQFQTYQSEFRKFDVIHDFSHQHFASRFISNLPSLNIFWHAPNEVQYPKAPYNIIGLSKWACRMFECYYHQKARWQISIALDTHLYSPAGERGDRFLTIGRMGPDKGNLEAAQLCKEMNVPLDIAGQAGDKNYMDSVLTLCDGDKIKYVGEVTEVEKVALMQKCKGLIYYLRRPEVTSHKIQEAMLCGAPIITSNIGALSEIVTHGVDGFLCNNHNEFRSAIGNVMALTPTKTRAKIAETYSMENVCRAYAPLYSQVANGLRW